MPAFHISLTEATQTCQPNFHTLVEAMPEKQDEAYDDRVIGEQI